MFNYKITKNLLESVTDIKRAKFVRKKRVEKRPEKFPKYLQVM